MSTPEPVDSKIDFRETDAYTAAQTQEKPRNREEDKKASALPEDKKQAIKMSFSSGFHGKRAGTGSISVQLKSQVWKETMYEFRLLVHVYTYISYTILLVTNST